MNPQELIASLIHQLESLIQVVNESPYLSRDKRKGLEKEISDFSEKLQEGNILFPQGEKILTDLDQQAAADEIISLMTKIGHLNPSSPRLENLCELSQKLNSGEISPTQARNSIQNLMQ